MTDYQFVGYRLLNSTSITDVVSNRIYHGEIPETVTTLPAINYFIVSRPNNILNGHYERPRYQISCRASTPGAVVDLAHKVHSAFNNLQGSIGGFDVQNTYYENSFVITEPDNVYHVPVDVFIQYINE